MSEPECVRCGPRGLPVVLVDVGTPKEPCMVCLRCHVDRERIEPTARKGGKPAMPFRANPERLRLPVKP